MFENPKLRAAAWQAVNDRSKSIEINNINPPDKHDYVLEIFDKNKIDRFTDYIESGSPSEKFTNFYNQIISEFEITTNS